MTDTAPLLPHHARIDVSFADCDIIARAVRWVAAEVDNLTPEETVRLPDIEARFGALHDAAKRGGHVGEQRTYTADEVRAWLLERARDRANTGLGAAADALLCAREEFGRGT
jgi:hypothetical protein